MGRAWILVSLVLCVAAAAAAAAAAGARRKTFGSTVETVLVLDSAALARFDNDTAAAGEFAAALGRQVDAYYQDTGLDAHVSLVAVVVWPTGGDAVNVTSDPTTLLDRFAAWAPGALPPHDAAALVAGGPFDGDTLGKGVLQPSGPCPAAADPPDARNMYTACLLQWREGDPDETLALTASTVAHEMGHNLGAQHSDPECEGAFIMRTTGGRLWRWSNCTLDKFAEVLPNSGACLGAAAGNDTVAVECPFGEFGGGGVDCQPCAAPCEDCAGASGSWCTRCPDGLALFNGACETWCPGGYLPSGPGPFGSRCVAVDDVAGDATLLPCDEAALPAERPTCDSAGLAVTCNAGGTSPECVPVPGYVRSCARAVTAPASLRECGASDSRYAVRCNEAGEAECRRIDRVVTRAVLVVGQSLMWAAVTVVGAAFMLAVHSRSLQEQEKQVQQLQQRPHGKRAGAAGEGGDDDHDNSGSDEEAPPPPPPPSQPLDDVGVELDVAPAPKRGAGSSPASKPVPSRRQLLRRTETPAVGALAGSGGRARKKKRAVLVSSSRARTPAEIAAASAALPAGWTMHKDEASGCWFYAHEDGRTRWEAPA